MRYKYFQCVFYCLTWHISSNTCGYTGVPSEPGNLKIVVEQTHLKVQWTAPYAHPGYSILSYFLQINNSESGSIQVQLSGNTTEYTVNITNIGADCDVLVVSLSAQNSVGKGTPALSEVSLSICKKCC